MIDSSLKTVVAAPAATAARLHTQAGFSGERGWTAWRVVSKGRSRGNGIASRNARWLQDRIIGIDGPKLRGQQAGAASMRIGAMIVRGRIVPTVVHAGRMVHASGA
jgi:hypothetical protein